MLTVLLGLLAALAYALSDWLSQRVTRGGATVVSALTWILTTGALVTLPVALLLGGLPHGDAAWRALGYAALGGAVYLVAYSSLLRGLRRGSLSVITPLASLQGASGAVLAILIGERVHSLTAVGLALAVLGAVMAAMQRGRRTAAGAGWGLFAALTFGVVLVLYGAATAVPAVAAVAVSRVVSLALVTPLAVRRGVHVPRDLRLTAVLSGALEAGGFFALVAAVSRGPVAVASVLVAQFATFAVVLGLVANRERPARRQLAGVVITVVAVTVLAVAQS